MTKEISNDSYISVNVAMSQLKVMEIYANIEAEKSDSGSGQYHRFLGLATEARQTQVILTEAIKEIEREES